jgi:hypothetical protein
MSERLKAFRRARGYHLRRHGGPMLGCTSEVCVNRVWRLRSGIQPWAIAPYEQGGRMQSLRVAILAGSGNR